MKTATATLSSVSPYSQSRYHAEPKLSKEGADAHEERTWRKRLHVSDGGTVFIPPMAFKNCLDDSATYMSAELQIPGQNKARYTKHIHSGVLVLDGLDLGIGPDAVSGEWLRMSPSGKRNDGKRVSRCYPRIDSWAGDVTFYIGDDTVTKDVFVKVLENAGRFVGIGRFRPLNRGFYGRFGRTNSSD